MKPWWMNNGTLKKAAWIAALVFAAGGGWYLTLSSGPWTVCRSGC